MIEKKDLKNYQSMISMAEYAVVIITTLFFCASMTFAAQFSKHFDSIMDLWMLFCIIIGLVSTAARRKNLDKSVLVLTVLYFLTRVISYKLNGISITYGGAIMLQVFYLVGVCRKTFGGKKKAEAALYTFLAFNVWVLIACFFNFHFRKEYVAGLYEDYWIKGMIPEASVFQSSNYAGMMAGAAIVAGCAMIVNSRFRKKTVLLMCPVVIANLYMLFKYTGCRSAQTGIIVVGITAAVIAVFKKADSVRRVVSGFLIVCFLTLIPLYVLVYWGDNEDHLSDGTSLELQLETVSSLRYSLWKTTILSMEGHELFGYGNVSTAWDKRKELVNNNPADDTAEVYVMSIDHKRQHNGYLALLNEAGIAGAVCMLLLLLCRAGKLKGRFRDGQWEKLLLPYIFWLNLFEAKFILHVFFTGLLMMILLLPDEEVSVK